MDSLYVVTLGVDDEVYGKIIKSERFPSENDGLKWALDIMLKEKIIDLEYYIDCITDYQLDPIEMEDACEELEDKLRNKIHTSVGLTKVSKKYGNPDFEDKWWFNIEKKDFSG